MFSSSFLALRVVPWFGHWSSVADLHINRCAVQPSKDSVIPSLFSGNSVWWAKCHNEHKTWEDIHIESSWLNGRKIVGVNLNSLILKWSLSSRSEGAHCPHSKGPQPRHTLKGAPGTGSCSLPKNIAKKRKMVKLSTSLGWLTFVLSSSNSVPLGDLVFLIL